MHNHWKFALFHVTMKQVSKAILIGIEASQMIYGLGIDATDIARVVAAQERNIDFAAKVLTPKELAFYQTLKERRAAEFLAGRFSVKEAYSKAFGTGLGKVQLQDVETLNNEAGKPVITKHPFDGKAFVSITHTDTLVFTEVILERSEA